MLLRGRSLIIEVSSNKPRSTQATTRSDAHRNLLVRALDALSMCPLVLVVESRHVRKPLHCRIQAVQIPQAMEDREERIRTKRQLEIQKACPMMCEHVDSWFV